VATFRRKLTRKGTFVAVVLALTATALAAWLVPDATGPLGQAIRGLSPPDPPPRMLAQEPLRRVEIVPSPELTRALENSLRAIEDGDREAPRDRWDPAYIVEQLGDRPEDLFAWVRDNTYWIPYRGVLRGPAGVLMDRLGNSLDRSLLLARLLRKAGHPVRLARAELTRDQALGLLPAMVSFRDQSGVEDPRPAATHPALRDEVRAVAEQYQLDTTSVLGRFDSDVDAASGVEALLGARVLDQTPRLAAGLARPDANAAWKTRLERSIAILRDHWWVQWQNGTQWMDLDLAHDDLGERIVAAQETADVDALAPDLWHTIVIRVIGEQTVNGTRTEQTALEHTLRPADLIGTPISLVFLPSDPSILTAGGEAGQMALRSAALKQDEWVPALQIGTETIVQSTLRANGNLGVTTEPAAGPGGLVGALSGVLDGVFGTPKADLPDAGPAGQLTAAWIDFEIRVPGEAARTERRVVFDLIDPAGRAGARPPRSELDEAQRFERSLALMMDTEILPLSSWIPTEFIAHLTGKSLIANRETLRLLTSGQLPEGTVKFESFAKRAVATPGLLYSLAHIRFAWSPLGDRAHIDRPNVLARHVFLSPRNDAIALVHALDIVANEVGVDLRDPDEFGTRLAQGVLDTNAEALLRSRPHALNVGNAFALVQDWATVDTPADAERLQLSDADRRRLADDIRRGAVAVAPKAPVTLGQEQFVGWWRIDPAAGHALGVGSTGWGQGPLETLVQIGRDIARSQATREILIAAAISWLACETDGSWRAPVIEARSSPSKPEWRLPAIDHIVAPVHAAESCIGAAAWGGLIGGGIGAWGNLRLGGRLRGLYRRAPVDRLPRAEPRPTAEGAPTTRAASEPGAGRGDPGYPPFRRFADRAERTDIVESTERTLAKSSRDMEEALARHRRATAEYEAAGAKSDSKEFLAKVDAERAVARAEREKYYAELAHGTSRRMAGPGEALEHATARKNAADEVYRRALEKGADFKSKEYTDWKEAFDRYHEAREHYDDAYWERPKGGSSGATAPPGSKTAPLGTSPTIPGGPPPGSLPPRPDTLPLGTSPTIPGSPPPGSRPPRPDTLPLGTSPTIPGGSPPPCPMPPCTAISPLAKSIGGITGVHTILIPPVKP
jgi:hypothetical protein